MITCHAPRFVQIHIPRTGGTAFALALAKVFPHAHLDVQYGKHAPARRIAATEAWPDSFRWSVMRDPAEIVSSWWCNVATWWRDVGTRFPDGSHEYTHGWYSYCRQMVNRGFRDWFEQDVLGGVFAPGGFAAHSLEPHVSELHLFRFEDRMRAWVQICRRLEIEPVPVPPMAAVGDIRYRPKLTRRDRDAIRTEFAGDYELLGEIPRLSS